MSKELIERLRDDQVTGFNLTVAACEAADRIEQLDAAIQSAESEGKEAAMFRYLQSIDSKEAQAFFWNHSSRKERAKAIAAAMKGAEG